MWTADCIYCKKPIKDQEPCYCVYSGMTKLGYHHVGCQKDTVPQKPFGHVTEEDGELD